MTMKTPANIRPGASELGSPWRGWGSNAVSCRVSVRFRDSPGAATLHSACVSPGHLIHCPLCSGPARQYV